MYELLFDYKLGGRGILFKENVFKVFSCDTLTPPELTTDA